MRALKYSIVEAVAGLWRGRRAATLAILTIGAGLFVLGFFLVLTANLERVVARWGEAAEFSVYLKDDITEDQLRAIDGLLAGASGIVRREYISKAEALRRFKSEFRELAALPDTFSGNPFPASFEIRLRSGTDAGAEAERLAAELSGKPGVADIQYDRRWLERLMQAVTVLRGVGLGVVSLLAIAAALTVANVVRLTAYARRDEIEIMQLVGAPLVYVRGPFVAEGALEGGLGAVGALALLWGIFVLVRARYGPLLSDALGLADLGFLPILTALILVAGGMALGLVGGFVAARWTK